MLLLCDLRLNLLYLNSFCVQLPAQSDHLALVHKLQPLLPHLQLCCFIQSCALVIAAAMLDDALCKACVSRKALAWLQGNAGQQQIEMR
jgi:hypothetical protein